MVVYLMKQGADPASLDIEGGVTLELSLEEVYCSVNTKTRTRGRRLSNHNVFWKQKVLKFFFKQTNKIQGSTKQPLKTVWTYLISQETALK